MASKVMDLTYNKVYLKIESSYPEWPNITIDILVDHIKVIKLRSNNVC